MLFCSMIAIFGEPSCNSIKNSYEGCCGIADQDAPSPRGTPPWMADPSVNLAADMFGFTKFDELAATPGSLYPNAVYPTYPDAQWSSFDNKNDYATVNTTEHDFELFRRSYFETLKSYLSNDEFTPEHTFDDSKSFFENTNIISLQLIKKVHGTDKPFEGKQILIAGANSNQGGAAAILLAYLGAKEVILMSRTELSFTRYRDAARTNGSMTALWKEALSWCSSENRIRGGALNSYPIIDPMDPDFLGAASSNQAASAYSSYPNFDGFDVSQFEAAGITDFDPEDVWNNRIKHIVVDVRNTTARDQVVHMYASTLDYLIVTGGTWGNAKPFLKNTPYSAMPFALQPSPYVVDIMKGGMGLSGHPTDEQIVAKTPDGSAAFMWESSQVTQQAFDNLVHAFVSVNKTIKVLAVTSGLNYLPAYTSFGPLSGLGEYMSAKTAFRQSMYTLGLYGVFLAPHTETFFKYVLPYISKGSIAPIIYTELASPYDVTMMAPTLIANDFNTFQAVSNPKMPRICPNFENLHSTYRNRLEEYANLRQLEVILSTAQELGVLTLTSGMSGMSFIPALLHTKTINPATVPNAFAFGANIYPPGDVTRMKRFAEFFQSAGLNNFNSFGMLLWGVLGSNAPFLPLTKTPRIVEFLKQPFQQATSAIQMLSAATNIF